jgi:precorrin-2 methylase
MNSNLHSFQVFYAEAKDRRTTYKEMVHAMMTEVRAGKKVVIVFYGHSSIFLLSAHKVIKTAKKEGYAAHMVPGISAVDCLYADLCIDPGKLGSQHFEAS